MPYALSDFFQFTGCMARIWHASHSFLAPMISDPEHELPFQTAEMFAYSFWSSLGYLVGYIGPLDRRSIFFFFSRQHLYLFVLKFWLIIVKALLNSQCMNRGRFCLLSLHFLSIEEMLTNTSQLQVYYFSSPSLVTGTADWQPPVTADFAPLQRGGQGGDLHVTHGVLCAFVELQKQTVKIFSSHFEDMITWSSHNL